MELIEAIYQRRAVRRFQEKEVPRLTLIELMNAAVQAPSAVNQQPWAFAVFRGRDRLRNWSERAKSHFLESLDGASGPPGLREMLEDPDYNIFYNSSILLVICARPGGLNPAEDCCLAAQNLMLAAHGMGLGTCPIGFARPWLSQPSVKKEIGFPPDIEPVFPLIVGWPAETPPAVPRREPEILVWDKTD